MSTGKKCNQDVFDHVFMTNHSLRHFRAKTSKGFLKFRHCAIGCTHCDSPREKRRLTISSYSGGTCDFRIASSSDCRRLKLLVDFSMMPPSYLSASSRFSPVITRSWVASSASWNVLAPPPSS